MKPDQEVAEKFRAAFAYDEKETLLGCVFCNDFILIKMYSLLNRFSGIYRLLPVLGKLYISKNQFCFMSSGPLVEFELVAFIYLVLFDGLGMVFNR